MRSQGEVYYRCPVCRCHLAASAEAAGRLEVCPGCRSSHLVPAVSSALSPGLRRGLLIGASHACLAAMLTAGGLWLMKPADKATPAAPPAVSRVAAPLEPRGAAGSVGRVSRDQSGGAMPDGDVFAPAVREWQSAYQTTRAKYEELANWVLSNMRGHVLVKDRLASHLRVPPLGADFTLHPDMAEWLQVDERERGLLEDAFIYGSESIDDLEARLVTATQTVPGRVSLTIPPYEEAGQQLQEDLYGALETVLGPSRFDRLIAAGEEELTKQYHYFGQASRTIAFNAQQDAEGQPVLIIRDGWIVPEGEGRRSIAVAETAVRELPSSYQRYLPWLPDFVATYAKP